MSYRYPDIQKEFAITALIHRWNANLNAEIAAVVAALGSDTTTHDATIETPPVALRIGADKTRLTNDLLHTVNKGKGGNLSNSQIIGALDGVAGVLYPPAVVDIPYCSAVGAVASVTNGNWDGTPGSYAYAWKRNGTVAVGTNSSSYTMVAGDTGQQIGCIVSATNPTGTTAAPLSNTVRGP